MVLQRAILELDADVDNGPDTGIFEMVGNLEISERTIVEHTIASGQGAVINAVIADNIDRLGDITTNSPDVRNRAGFYLDLGGGEHNIQIDFVGWDGATDADGEPLQWGNTGNPDVKTPGDATGSDPLSQMQCLQRYLQMGTFDSRREAARLRFGEYSQDGMYEDYLQVTVTQNSMNRVSTEPVSFDGSIVLTECKNWDNIWDDVSRIEW